MTWDLDVLEQEIVAAAAAGLDEEEIADAIGSTSTQVEAVLDRVMKDLGLASRLELILFVHWHRSAENKLAAGYLATRTG